MEQENIKKNINTEKPETEVREVFSDTKKNTKNQNNIFVIVAIAGIVGFLLANFIQNNQSNEVEYVPSETTQENDSKESFAKNPFSAILSISSTDAFFGDKNAETIVFEYSDVGCPNCARFHSTVTGVVNESVGGVVRVYRHFPVIRDFSQHGAVVAECVKNKFGNEAFFNFLNKVFSRNLNKSVLTDIGIEYGLTDSDITSCLANNSKENNLIRSYVEQASLVGIRGTPNGFIYNKKTGKYSRLFGAIPKNELERLINKLK